MKTKLFIVVVCLLVPFLSVADSVGTQVPWRPWIAEGTSLESDYKGTNFLVYSKQTADKTFAKKEDLLEKQNLLPYPTNAIPYSVLTNVPEPVLGYSTVSDIRVFETNVSTIVYTFDSTNYVNQFKITGISIDSISLDEFHFGSEPPSDYYVGTWELHVTAVPSSDTLSLLYDSSITYVGQSNPNTLPAVANTERTYVFAIRLINGATEKWQFNYTYWY